MEVTLNGSNEIQFSKHTKFYNFILVFLLVTGFLIRMIDLTDPPLAYHPTRQLRAAIISRNIFLSVKPEAAPKYAQYATDPALYDYVTRREPPITEAVVALIYIILGNEILWVSRIVTALFWCFGGVGLYLLVRRMTSKDAGLISLSFYLFAPFGVIGSRSFQPESLMVASIIWALLFFTIWLDKKSWKNALIAGGLSGFAILVKPNALFILFAAYLIVLISSDGLNKSVKNIQAWVMAGISAIIPGIFYLFINPAAGGFLDNWWTDIVHIIPTSRYFLGWGSIITDAVPFAVLIIAFASTLLLEKRDRNLVIGIWVGYVTLGIFAPHHIYTHDYYSIVLVPIAAISIGKVVQLIAAYASKKETIWKIGLTLIGIMAIAYPTWNIYKDLQEKNYRGEPGGWVQISEAIPEGRKVIALTHNYGFNMAYYGYRMLPLWPYTFDMDLQSIRGFDRSTDSDIFFEQMTGSYDLFLVTHFGELNSQPMLMEKLSELHIYDEGPGYVLYDLSSE